MMASFELSGSVSEKDKTFIETWENVSPGVNYVIRENRRGDEEYIPVIGPRQFKLSTYDRMLTEDKIVEDRLNPFLNGSFRPIIVPADVTIESNPNAMSEDDIKQLFGASDIAWDEYMAVIDSPSTLQRMVDIANNGEADLSHRRFQQLASMQSRYSMLGKQAIKQRDQKEYEQMGGSGIEPISQPKKAVGRPPKIANA